MGATSWFYGSTSNGSVCCILAYPFKPLKTYEKQTPWFGSRHGPCLSLFTVELPTADHVGIPPTAAIGVTMLERLPSLGGVEEATDLRDQTTKRPNPMG